MTGRLIVQDIYTAYDRADVLSGLSIEVVPGTITCILGSNGAGKSTLIRSILRLTPPRAGSIAFDGITLDNMQTHDIIGLGIACIPEGRRIFAKMTVEENLRVGAYLVSSEKAIQVRLAKVYETFPRLSRRWSRSAAA
jgi:branched-chain amino acid transport system ATP-binding protein